MQHRPLGSSGIEASVVALGAWAIGGWRWGGSDDQQSITAIHAALDAGITLIDTAPAYGDGHSETVLGRALVDRRDKVVLATKCGIRRNLGKGELLFRCDKDGNQVPDGAIELCKYLGPESVREECEASLTRLQTDYIDLYQTHWPESTTAIEDTMAELLKLKEEGKIRAIGVCNATIAQMDRYRAVGEIVSDQERYSMLDRRLDAEQLPFAQTNSMAVLAYSPLAHGLLSGKVTPDRVFPNGDLRRDHPRYTAENRAKIAQLLETIAPIAETHALTSAQLAVAWTVAQPGLTHALVGARNEQQAQENSAAGSVVLSSDEVTAINRAIEHYVSDIP